MKIIPVSQYQMWAASTLVAVPSVPLAGALLFFASNPASGSTPFLIIAGISLVLLLAGGIIACYIGSTVAYATSPAAAAVFAAVFITSLLVGGLAETGTYDLASTSVLIMGAIAVGSSIMMAFFIRSPYRGSGDILEFTSEEGFLPLFAALLPFGAGTMLGGLILLNRRRRIASA